MNNAPDDRARAHHGAAFRAIAGGILATLLGASGAVLIVVFDGKALAAGSLGVGGFALYLIPAALFGTFMLMGARAILAGLRGYSAASGSPSLGPSQEVNWRRRLAVRVYASGPLRLGAAVLAAGILLGALALPGLGVRVDWISPFLVGAAAMLVVFLLQARGAQQECAFCGTGRARVKFLVAGASAGICDACAQAALASFAEHFNGRGQVSEWCGRFLQSLPSRCPRALSRPFIERVVGAERSPAGVRNAVAWCFKLGNEPLAGELIEMIPEAERLPTDWLNLGVALSHEGRHDEALRATAAAAIGGDAVRPWLLNNSAWMNARRSGDASDAERTEWLRQVDEAQRLLDASRPNGWERSMPYFLGTEAELRRQLGDHEGVLQVLARANGLASLTGDQLLIRARALAALGRKGEARQDLERALVVLHPEGLEAGEAHRLLESIAQ